MAKSYSFKHLFAGASLLLGFALTSCGTIGTQTRGTLYPKMYSQRPASILIMPPINQTNHVDAKDYFYTSLMQPLSERGYYVFSPYLAMELLRQESAADAEMFVEGSLRPFRQVFGADAALFTYIKKWEKSPLNSTIDVEVEYVLKSTANEDELFRRNVSVTVDCSVVQGASAGFLGPLLSVVANALATAATETVTAARKANTFVLADLPYGKYCTSQYDKDQSAPATSPNISGVTVR